MAEPPEEPPGGLFDEPPEEPPDDLDEQRAHEPGGRYRDSPDEPPHEPRDDLDEQRAHEPGGRYRDSPDEPPHEPGGGHREPQEPLEDLDEEPPKERGEGYLEPPQEREGHGRYRDVPEEPQDDEPLGRYREPPHEPPDEPLGRYREPRQKPPDEPRVGYRDLSEEPPDEPGPRRGPPPQRGRLFRRRPPPDLPGGRFAGPSDPGEPPDHPTGELLDDRLDHPTGELFDDERDDDLPVAPTGDLLGDLGEAVHSPSELAQRRAQERAQRRRAGQQRLLFLVLGLAVLVVIVVLLVNNNSSTPTSTTASGNPLSASGTGPGYLLAGSSTSALTANILIADRNNNRLVAITPRGQVVWHAAHTGPADAFPSRTGKSIVVTEPGAFVALQFSVADGVVLYRYGHSGHPGSANNLLHDPETAQQLSDGRIVVADKSNCRILFLAPPVHHPKSQLGGPGSCVHDPPKTLAYPDAVFPAIGGGIVVTELNPNWVDVLNSSNRPVAALRVPGLSAPDDANEYAAGKLIATSHTHPGVIQEFDTNGTVTWSYGPTSGAGELDRPSLAEVLPDGNVLVCDSGNDRVVVIDPQTNTIIWQYGHTGKPGSKPGYLHTPDSAVLVP